MNKIEIEGKGGSTISITQPFWGDGNPFRTGLDDLPEQIQREINREAARIEQIGRGMLRDGRTLLPTTPAALAEQINGNPAVSLADTICAKLRRLWIAYLRWDLRGVEAGVENIPKERRDMLERNDWKHQHRALEINNEARRREQEGKNRIAELKSHLRRMGVEL